MGDVREIPGDEAVAGLSSSSSATAEPSKETLGGIWAAKAARAVARADMEGGAEKGATEDG